MHGIRDMLQRDKTKHRSKAKENNPSMQTRSVKPTNTTSTENEKLTDTTSGINNTTTDTNTDTMAEAQEKKPS